MTEQPEQLIQIRWRVERQEQKTVFRLVSITPGYEDLQVSVDESEGMSERRARATLMREMYDLGRQKGIRPHKLRFIINGL